MDKAVSTSLNWSCRNTWKTSAKNTAWCLLGCAIGDFGTILFFQITKSSLVHCASWSDRARRQILFWGMCFSPNGVLTFRPRVGGFSRAFGNVLDRTPQRRKFSLHKGSTAPRLGRFPCRLFSGIENRSCA